MYEDVIPLGCQAVTRQSVSLGTLCFHCPPKASCVYPNVLYKYHHFSVSHVGKQVGEHELGEHQLPFVSSHTHRGSLQELDSESCTGMIWCKEQRWEFGLWLMFPHNKLRILCRPLYLSGLPQLSHLKKYEWTGHDIL